MSKSQLFMPWWPQTDAESARTFETYHSRAHLPGHHEALLVDLGAYDNLTGEDWVHRAGLLAERAGRMPTRASLQQPMKVQGVGKQTQQCEEMVLMPGELENGDIIEYTAPIIPASPIPALWGLRSTERQNAVVDTRVHERKVYLGDDVQIVPGPRTRIIQMQKAESGHLMVPITHFESQKTSRGSAKQQKYHPPQLHLHQSVVMEVTEPTAPSRCRLADDRVPAAATSLALAEHGQSPVTALSGAPIENQ